MRQAKHIVVVACGSTAIVDLPRNIGLLQTELSQKLSVILSSSAARLLPAETLRGATMNVTVESDWLTSSGEATHLAATQGADLVVVSPATGNTLVKAALGIADNPALAALLFTDVPVIFAPAMNRSAWQKGPIRRAVETLRSDGRYVIDPLPGLSLYDQDPAGALGTPAEQLLAHCRHFLSACQAASYADEAIRTPARPPSVITPVDLLIGQQPNQPN